MEKNSADETAVLQQRMSRIKHKILVLSGKGGVGKSTVAANLALALRKLDKSVGLLDVDIHGPSIPTMFNLSDRPLINEDGNVVPAEFATIKIMSIGLFLGGSDDAVIWRGPMKYGAIQQLLRDVEWGDLDYLVIDCPPGTGDEPLSVVQLVGIGPLDGAVIITTPQDLALLDVRRSIRFCHQLKVPVLGIVENMSGFTCPTCGTHIDIFSAGGGKDLALKLKTPFLGAVPIDPVVVESGDQGLPVVLSHPDSHAAEAFEKIAGALVEQQKG
ncbi:MAG: Mrp/NBP35 family ATP-binding protein [Actinobacteria bacterium]|nr:Mrp/NBP35 family ATP-binding protein [Actinomycetota bacterium]